MQPRVIQQAGRNLIAQLADDRTDRIGYDRRTMFVNESCELRRSEEFVHRRQLAKQFRFRYALHRHRVCKYASRSCMSCGLSFWLKPGISLRPRRTISATRSSLAGRPLNERYLRWKTPFSPGPFLPRVE